MGILRRGAVVAAVAALALAATAGVAVAKTVPDAAYAARVCAEVAKVLEPLQELRGVDSADYAAYRAAAIDRLTEASEASEAAEKSLAKVTSKSGGAKAARTFDFFFGERARAFEDARDQFEDGDPTDSSFQSEIRAFVDVLADSPFGFNDPFGASTITKKKALAKAFDADETCAAVKAEFD